MKTYYIKTFGCQMNVADSNLMQAHFESLGMVQAKDLSDADTVVVNTCTVRDHAEHTAMSYVGRLKPFKNDNPNLKVILAGCAAQRVGENIKKRFPIIDLVVGAKNIENFKKEFNKICELDSCFRGNDNKRAGDDSRHGKNEGKNRGKGNVCDFVTIMRGCENFCSYCIVPSVRGPELSRPFDEILSEIETRVKLGAKDITLLGQNVNSYRGADKHGKKQDFASLLTKVNSVKGLDRIRFMTSHPKDLGQKLIKTIAGLEKVCEHIHLPLQSGSDRILKAMNRNYKTSDYLKIIDTIRKEMPAAAITTDIMVGFPGETKKDFEKTLAVTDRASYDFIFAFKYSPRPGTKAAELKDRVSLKTKEGRHAILLEKLNKADENLNRKLIGSAQEVLVEGAADGKYFGKTRTNKKVYFSSGRIKPGSLVKVKILQAKFN